LEVDSSFEELLQPRFDLDPQIRALIKIDDVAHDALEFRAIGYDNLRVRRKLGRVVIPPRENQ
jgi:hypothetical protein